MKTLFVIGLDKKEVEFGRKVASKVSDIEDLIIYEVINSVSYRRNEISESVFINLKRKAYEEVLNFVKERNIKSVIDLHSTSKGMSPKCFVAGIKTTESQPYRHLVRGGVHIEEISQFGELFLPKEFILPNQTPHYVALEIYMNTEDHQNEINLAEKLTREIYLIQEAF